MKFIHIADLHFGKQLHGISLIREGDQPYWVEQCIGIIGEERPDAVLIAGDVYDRSQPPSEARKLAGSFLTRLCKLGVPVFMVAGNHDSGENIAYLKDLLCELGLHTAGTIDAKLDRVRLQDRFGPVDIYLMPYFFPARVNEVLGCSCAGYTEAARTLIEAQEIDRGARNVLLAHQLVLSNGVSPVRGGSETSVGGIGQIDVDVFADFDYVALGHIHRAQSIGRPGIRYAGSPLCYHFSEAGETDEGNERGLLVVELGEKGTTPVTRVRPIAPKHPLRNRTGKLAEVLNREQADPRRDEYLHVRLTDDELPTDAADRLKAVIEGNGSRLLWLDREPREAGQAGEDRRVEAAEWSLSEYFAEFYRNRNGAEPSEGELEMMEMAEHLVARQHSGLSAEDAAQELIGFALSQEVEQA